MTDGKILLELCFGTTCFVMGASKLQEIESLIPPQYKNKVEVKAHTCILKAIERKIDG